jgi:hypothetical protein
LVHRLTPIIGEYVHFTKVMLLKEIRNSFTPDLAFVGRQSTAALPSAEDEQVRILTSRAHLIQP